MTDRTPDSPDDEIVSAYLDGAATPDETAQVEADPALADRLGTFAAVSERVRDLPPPPPGALDAALDAALSAFDEHPVADTDGDLAAPIPMADRRQTAPSRRGRTNPLPVVAAAAAVILVVAVIGLAGLTTRGGDDTATASLDLAEAPLDDAGGLDEGADGSFDPGDDAAADGSGGNHGLAASPESMSGDAPAGDAPSGEARSSGERLRFADADSLADHLREQFGPTAAEPTTASGGQTSEDAGADKDPDQADPDEADPDRDPCKAVDVLGLDPDAVVTVVPIVLDGDPATAVVHDDDGRRRLGVVDDSTCQTIIDRDL